jgi:hypothetical protein
MSRASLSKKASTAGKVCIVLVGFWERKQLIPQPSRLSAQKKKQNNRTRKQAWVDKNRDRARKYAREWRKGNVERTKYRIMSHYHRKLIALQKNAPE